MKTGILGGTFDPIHFGHLRLAEAARDEVGLDRVLFVLSASPPHKSIQGISPVNERWELLQIACSDNPAFHPSAIEMQRQGPSYTVETLERIREEGSGRDDYFLILGMDSLLELPTWKDYRRILDLARPIAAARTDSDISSADPYVTSKAVLLDFPPLDISSTEIRRAVREGRSIRYLTPEPVRRRVEQLGLYRPPMAQSTGREDAVPRSRAL